MNWSVVIPMVVWAVIGFVVLSKMAASRGRNTLGWGLFGAVGFLVALIVILIAGPSDDRAGA